MYMNVPARQAWRPNLLGPVLVTVGLVTAAPTQAVVYPESVNAHLDAEIERFVGASRFFQLDPDYFDSPEWNSQERFPFGHSPYTDYRDWGLSAAGKAIMALEAFEPPLPYTRYRVSVRNVDGNADYPKVMRLVEVVRFNPGPTLAENVREIYGDQFTPSAEDIGVGPDTAYRFAMPDAQGLSNQIAAFSRRVLSDVEARNFDCLGTPCLALVDPGDAGWDWADISVAEDGNVVPYRMRDDRGLFAWAVKAALIEPFAIACMMDVYFRTIEGQVPNAEWDAKLSGMSKQFTKVKDKAAGWQPASTRSTMGSSMQGGATT